MRTDPRPLAVLIVDDCPDTAASFGELVALYGHDARTAEGAAAALDLVAGWQPDVALLDLAMPVTNGFDLARLLWVSITARPLLVAVTGLQTRAYRERAARAGFDHFLVKPVDPDVLIDLLRNHAAGLWAAVAERVAE